MFGVCYARLVAFRSVAWLCLLAACLTSCDPASTRGGKIALKPCRPEGLTVPALCGTYPVFENRKAQEGRKIDLRVLLVPALKSEHDDPVFFLAGGPGQASSEAAKMVLPALQKLHRGRDLVFVDQRGTGSSNPLKCDPSKDEGDLAEHFRTDFPLDEVDDCRKKLEAKADLRQYLTTVAADDLDEVRDAMGYAKVNLVGGSYGTRAALVYAKRHPSRVRSIVLDGVAPTTMRLFLDFLVDAQRALDLVLSQCADDKACTAAYPNLKADVDELLEQLDSEPVTTTVRHPQTGERVELTIDREVFTGTLRSLLYSADITQLTPLLVAKAKRGDWSGFVAQGYLLGSAMEEALSTGMFLSVACAEDVVRITDAERDELGGQSFLGPEPTKKIQEVCSHWPVADVEPGYNEPIRLDTPTLVLSGKLDPVTPPRWGEEVAKHLSRSKHVVAPGVGHGVLGVRCVRDVLADFVGGATTNGLDVSCLENTKRPPFFIDLLGPAP